MTDLDAIINRVEGLSSMPNWLLTGLIAVRDATPLPVIATTLTRDDYAKAAMQGMFADSHVDEKIESGEWPREDVPAYLANMAEWAYLMADLMLVRSAMPPQDYDISVPTQ